MTILDLFAELLPRRLQILSLGGGLEGRFQAWVAGRVGSPKRSDKICHFVRTYTLQLFQALGPFPSSSPCPKHILPCPPQSPGPSGGLVLTFFFLRQKFHFREFVAISKFSTFSRPGSFNHDFSELRSTSGRNESF